MEAFLSSRSSGMYLQPPRPSVQMHAAAALPPARLLVRAQAARPPPPAERRERAATPSGQRRRGPGGGSGGSGGQRQRGPVRQAGGKPGGGSEELRLNKAIAAAGVTSRRGADDLIFEGRVTVNGQVVTEPGTQINFRKDKVAVDGRELSGAAASRKYYFALNKPRGYICSNKSEYEDEGEGRLVIRLFDDWLARWRQRESRASGGGGGGGGGGGSGGAGLPPRLFTVGRLDAQSIGLIFVTNDGDWAHKVMHPSSGITKEYSVTLNRRPTAAELEAIAAGCTMDGVFVQPMAVIKDDTDATKNNRVRVVVSEGRNREVRNLVEHAGLDVKALRRVRIGGYRIPRSLHFGEFVELKPHEVRRVLDLGADRSL